MLPSGADANVITMERRRTRRLHDAPMGPQQRRATRSPRPTSSRVVTSVACWFLFRGGRGWLLATVGLNVANVPLMFPQPGAWEMLGRQPFVLPTVILVQIVRTWLAGWSFARARERALDA